MCCICLKQQQHILRKSINKAISQLHPLMFKKIYTITKYWGVQIILYETDTIKYILISSII